MEKKVIVSEKSPAAIGPYSQAIEYNGLIYTSGVIGVNPATGEVGATIEEQTTQVFENLKGLHLLMPEAVWIRLLRQQFSLKIWMILEK